MGTDNGMDWHPSLLGTKKLESWQGNEKSAGLLLNTDY
jgi:hypothetical protein